MLLTAFTWINYRAGWYFVFTFSPSSTVRVRLCLRWTASKLSFWIILVFCDKLGTLYFWTLFKAVQYNSQVLHILMGTEDMTHRYWGYDSQVLGIWLTGTAYPHGPRVLRIWLTGTAYPHGYWGYDSWVLMIWLMGTDDMTHRYCISSWVLRIWLMGTE